MRLGFSTSRHSLKKCPAPYSDLEWAEATIVDGETHRPLTSEDKQTLVDVIGDDRLDDIDVEVISLVACDAQIEIYGSDWDWQLDELAMTVEIDGVFETLSTIADFEAQGLRGG